MAALIPTASATGSGTMTLAGPSTNSNQTITIPDATGTMMVSGNMPAFSAYLNGSQTLSTSTTTKVSIDTKTFDTATAYNNTGSTATLNGISVPSYSFAPPVAGYYQISTSLSVATTLSNVTLYLYKNGALLNNLGTSMGTSGSAGGCLVYLNGTSDYISFYGNFSVGQAIQNGSNATYFQAVMIRGA